MFYDYNFIFALLSNKKNLFLNKPIHLKSITSSAGTVSQLATITIKLHICLVPNTH